MGSRLPTCTSTWPTERRHPAGCWALAALGLALAASGCDSAGGGPRDGPTSPPVADATVDAAPADVGPTTDRASDRAGDRSIPVDGGKLPLADAPHLPCVVNTHAVPALECGWLHHIALSIVPLLQGTRDARLTTASVVAWWSLKEGILSLKNPIGYSNCNVPPDTPIGPLATCAAGHAWQVGISGSQVPGTTLTKLESLAQTLFPKSTTSQVLQEAAQQAGLDAATTQKVVASTGTLRNSWLLRVGAIGFTNQAPIVTGECITQSLSWCYSSAWSPSKLYAPTKTAALKAIQDVKTLFDKLAP
jgi:hypothetical protein